MDETTYAWLLNEAVNVAARRKRSLSEAKELLRTATDAAHDGRMPVVLEYLDRALAEIEKGRA